MKDETLDFMRKTCNAMRLLADKLYEDTAEAIESNDPIVVATHYSQLRDARELIKDARERLDELETRMSREDVPNVLRANKLPKGIFIEGIGRVGLSQRWSASIIDKDAGFQWLRNNNHEGLITETVNSSTLSAFAKDMFVNHNLELPEDIFKVGQMTITSITKK
jgi:hypothetical protein